MKPDFYFPPPGHPLHGHVAHIFRLRARDERAEEVLLPRVGMEIVFSFGDPVDGTGTMNGGAPLEMKEARISGLRDGPVRLRPRGALDIIGVSLRAESCAELLPMPACELTNVSCDAENVLADAGLIRERLAAAPDFAAQCSVILDWLGARLREHRHTAALRWACDRLRHDPSGAAISEIGRAFGASPRHARRVFAERIGMAPAAFLRLQRFAGALPLMQRCASLTELAHRAGYYDQPHFNREFRHFAGMAPQDYLRHAARIPDVLYTPI